jgi:hypothetical protein
MIGATGSRRPIAAIHLADAVGWVTSIREERMTRVEKWVWKETAEVIGVLGIIVSIVFLTMELRQNNELMEADVRATVLTMMTEIWTSAVEDPSLGATAIKDRKGETLTDEEELRLNAMWTRGLFNAEYVFQDAPEMLPQLAVMWRRAYSAYGSLRRTWSGDSVGSALDGKDMYSPEFVEYMDGNVFTP